MTTNETVPLTGACPREDNAFPVSLSERDGSMTGHLTAPARVCNSPEYLHLAIFIF